MTLVGAKHAPPEVRFFRFVEVQPNGCWLWTGVTGGTKSTYGYFTYTSAPPHHKMVAHRWSYEFHIGSIPEGLELDHCCPEQSNPLCVNPDHLEPVTSDENSRRARLAFCRSGLHDLSIAENVRWDEQGRRRGCMPCYRTRTRRNAAQRYARIKEARH